MRAAANFSRRDSPIIKSYGCERTELLFPCALFINPTFLSAPRLRMIPEIEDGGKNEPAPNTIISSREAERDFFAQTPTS
jgi:hypothetical protein